MPKIQYEGPQNSPVEIDATGNIVLPAGAGIDGQRFVTTAAENIYVDGVGGNDSNDGTMASPIATLAEGESRIPLAVHHPFAFRLMAQEYTVPVFRRRLLSAGIYLIADKAWDPTVETVQVTGGSGVSDTGTGAGVVVDTSGLLTPDALNGFTIEMTSGAATGQRRTIRDNTATDIVPCIPFGVSNAPASTDTFKVTRWNTCELLFPGVTNGSEIFFEGASEIDDGRTGGNASGFSGYCFVGMKLRADVAFLRPRFHDANYVFFGVEKGYGGAVSAGTGWSPLFIQAHAGFGARGTFTNPEFTAQAPLSLAASRDWLGWGLFQDVSTDRDIIVVPGAESSVLLAGVGKQLRHGANDRDSITQFVGRLEVTAALGTGAAVDILGPAKVIIGRTALSQPATRLFQTQGNNVVNVGVTGALGFASANNGRVICDIDNTVLETPIGSGGLVAAGGPSDVSISSTVTGVPPVVIPGFGSKAIRATAGAYVRLIGAPGIGGGVAESDFTVGSGVDKNKSFFAATGDHIAHTDGTVIARVS